MKLFNLFLTLALVIILSSFIAKNPNPKTAAYYNSLMDPYEVNKVKPSKATNNYDLMKSDSVSRESSSTIKKRKKSTKNKSIKQNKKHTRPDTAIDKLNSQNNFGIRNKLE